eukprot:gene5607-7739_t
MINEQLQTRQVYVCGINRKTTWDDIENHFFNCGNITSSDFDPLKRTGTCKILFKDQEGAKNAVYQFHHSQLNGTTLNIRFEPESLLSSGTAINEIAKISAIPFAPERKITNIKNNISKGETRKEYYYYTCDGIVVNDKEYPIPTGKYLMKLLQLCHSSHQFNKPDGNNLIDILIKNNEMSKDYSIANNSKELSESIAMVDCIYKLGHLTRTSWMNPLNQKVIVYVIGDGVLPFTSIALALFLPYITWQYVAIDPLLSFDKNRLGPNYSKRIHLFPIKTQDFIIPNNLSEFYDELSGNKDSSVEVTDCNSINNDSVSQDAGNDNATRTPYRNNDENIKVNDTKNDINNIISSVDCSDVISIIIACHSHAPLQEFWDRLPPHNKYCASLPCCGKSWSILSSTEPIHVYDDFEIYSPKRKIYLYHAP